MADQAPTAEALQLVLLYLGHKSIRRPTQDRPPRQPYSTSSLSGARWVELNLIHPRRCEDAFGLSPAGFKTLSAMLQDRGLILPTKHVSAKEILAIGLHVFRHAAGHRQAANTFNRSQPTISQ